MLLTLTSLFIVIFIFQIRKDIIKQKIEHRSYHLQERYHHIQEIRFKRIRRYTDIMRERPLSAEEYYALKTAVRNQSSLLITAAFYILIKPAYHHTKSC